MAKATVRQMAEAIYELTGSAKGVDTLARSVAAYLVEQKRTKELDKVLRELAKLRYERDGLLEIVATSKHELSEPTKKAISQIFETKNSKVIEQRDDDLVGGVRIQALDKWLDLSIRGRLNQLKNSNFRG